MSEPRGRSRAENGPAAPADEPTDTDTDTDSPSSAPADEPTDTDTDTDSPSSAPSDTSPGTSRRAVTVGVLVVLGIVGVAGGGALLVRNLTHGGSGGASAGGQAVATRWQRLPAGQIFPATIQYVNAQGVTQSARRIGIAPTASCQGGLDSGASASMAKLGCTMVLRATYADQSGALLATVGVAVVASPHDAATAASRVAASRPPAGVTPEAFSGTIADLFHDAQRAALGTPIAAGRYVFFYAAGYADGRPGQSASNNPDLNSLGRGLVTKVELVLTG